MALSASFAGFFLKKSSDGKSLYSVIFNKFLYTGIFFYLISSILSIWLLKKLPYSVVIPFGSLNYIFTIFIAFFLLDEKLSAGKITGVLFIFTGVIFISI